MIMIEMTSTIMTMTIITIIIITNNNGKNNNSDSNNNALNDDISNDDSNGNNKHVLGLKRMETHIKYTVLCLCCRILLTYLVVLHI